MPAILTVASLNSLNTRLTFVSSTDPKGAIQPNYFACGRGAKHCDERVCMSVHSLVSKNDLPKLQ